MGKPFKETKFGKFLSGGIGKGLVKSIPVAGPILGNILDDNGTPSGKVDLEDMKPQLIQGAIILLVLAYLMGWISFDQAETAKELLTD